MVARAIETPVNGTCTFSVKAPKHTHRKHQQDHRPANVGHRRAACCKIKEPIRTRLRGGDPGIGVIISAPIITYRTRCGAPFIRLLPGFDLPQFGLDPGSVPERFFVVAVIAAECVIIVVSRTLSTVWLLNGGNKIFTTTKNCVFEDESSLGWKEVTRWTIIGSGALNGSFFLLSFLVCRCRDLGGFRDV